MAPTAPGYRTKRWDHLGIVSGGCREIGLAGYLNDLNARHHELGSYPPRGASLAGDTLAVVRAEVGPLPDPNPRAIVDRPQAHT